MGKMLFVVVVLSVALLCRSQMTTHYTMHIPSLEVNEEDGEATICMSRTGDNIGTSGFVVLITTDESATGGEDFIALEEYRLTFEAFEKEKCLDIVIIDDDSAEFKERFKVMIVSASDGVPGSQPFTEITIEESDNCIQQDFTTSLEFHISPWQPVSGKPIVFKNTIGVDGGVNLYFSREPTGSSGDHYVIVVRSNGMFFTKTANGFFTITESVGILQGNVDETFEVTFDQSTATFVVSYSNEPTAKIVFIDTQGTPITVKHIHVSVTNSDASGMFTLCINDIIPLPQVNAEQSTTSVKYPNAIALRAIDGDVSSQVDGSGTCSVTARTQDTWFRIDLGQDYEVFGISIYPVGEGDESGLDGDDVAGVQVFVGSCNETYIEQLHLCGKAPDVITSTPLYIECTSSPYTYGQYVYIRHDTSDNVEKTLAFCEVKVYGTTVPFGSETTVTLSSASYEVGESDAIISINAGISGPGSSCAAVDIYTEDNTAISTSTNPDQFDFTAVPQETPQTIRFDPNTSNQVLNIVINPDKMCEEEETFNVILSNAQTSVLGIPSEALVTISDDDAIQYSLDNAANGFVIQEGDGPLEISILRSAEQNIEGDSRLSLILEEEGNRQIQTVMFKGEETSKEVSIDQLDDNVYNGNTAFTIRLQAIEECDTLLDGADMADVMVRDDDSRFCFDSLAENVLIPEDIGTYQIKVRREGTARDKTVGISIEHTVDGYGDAQPVNDFSIAGNTLQFESGVDEAYISFAIADDNFKEDEESFDLVLHDPNGISENVKTPNRIKVIVQDDDDIYRFHPQYYRVSEDEHSIDICIKRAGALTKTSTIKLATQDVTTTANRDYVDPSSGFDVTFPSSMSESCTSIRILDDSINEEIETFLVHILTNVEKEYNTRATISIYDSMDVLIGFDVDNYYVNEGDGIVTVHVIKVGDSQQSVSVSISSFPLTADTSDYVSVVDVIRIPPGTSKISYEVAINTDQSDESNERFKLTLSNPIGAVISLDTTTITIVDLESTPTLQPVNEISSALLSGIIVAAFTVTVLVALGVGLFCAYLLRRSSNAIHRQQYGPRKPMRLLYEQGTY